MKKSQRLISLCLVALVPISLLFSGCFYNNQSNALISAIKNEDIETALTLLEDGVDPNQTDVTPGWFWSFVEYAPRRPLSEACESGNLEIVQLLIDYGATAEVREGTGWSPLRKTLFYYQPDDVEIVRLLLENGAKIDCEEASALPMFWAASMQPKVYDKNKINGTVYAGGYDKETAESITEIVKMLMVEESKDERGYGIKTLLIIAVTKENIPLTNY